MKELTILKSKIVELSERLKDYIIYAPYRTDKIALFDVMKNVNKVILHFGNTVVPPKRVLFPQTETLFKFKKKGDRFELNQPSEKNKKMIIFGIRPCDAKSFLLLDKVFGKDFTDPYYKARRENTILMGLACNIPHYNCFCTAVGGSPHSSEELDMLWTEMDDNYYVEIFTKRGEEVIKNSLDLFSKPTEKDKKLKSQIKAQAEKGVIKKLDIEGLKEKLDKAFFNELYWAQEARKCIGCGACTYLCPTCHCFDINDYGSIINGKRVRTWDSCQYPDFTMHTSAHNPRPNKMSRLRQRLYHKFKYCPENYGILGCVGCGRCINRCPVNLDIVQILNNLKVKN